MCKFTIITLFCLFYGSMYAQNSVSASANDILSAYRYLPQQQLLDTANHYFDQNIASAALMCYSLIINAPVKENDTEHSKRIVEACNRSATLYCYMSDYSNAFNLLIKALQLCEEQNDTASEARIYNNFGNIYTYFNRNDMAKRCYVRALQLCSDTVGMVILLNNIGIIELENEKLDSAFYFLNRSMQISQQYGNIYASEIQNSIASYYRKNCRYDSAFHYLRLALTGARKNHEVEARNLLDLSNLFWEVNRADSALHYLNMLDTVATGNDFFEILAQSYLTRSKMEEAAGRHQNALKYFKTYSNLKDSVLDVKTYSNINQQQRLYEVSKTNRQIEISERTIRYRTIILYIVVTALLLVSAVLLAVFVQKRKLNRAYRTLFEKNIEIIGLQGNLPDELSENHKRSMPASGVQQKLMEKILTLMENTSLICDVDFSIDRLAELAESNQKYVSQVINSAQNKNFRSFLNRYRILEAQRLFQEDDAMKYTIESVAQRVGFRSRTAFRNAFKEFTGVSPSFYLKSMQKQKKN